MQRSFTLVAAVAALLAGAGSPARAQIVITQELVQAGSGSGLFYDAPGFPYTITRRGHYVLGENLIVPAGKTGIEFFVSGVTLDLNGFAITTSAQCTRVEATSSVFCDSAALGQESGIYAHNALVRGASSGLNGYDGYTLGNSMVLDSMATKNNGAGFRSLNPAPLAVGRNASFNNKQGDYYNIESLGQNIRTSLHVY